MLTLQRASAGSGKTYTLAKKYLWYLLTIKTNDSEGAPRRLRTDREVADGLGRILAITFTNKATNEMKQRIVDKLADLAKANREAPMTPEELKDIAYLDDFAKALNTDHRNIGRTAARALSVLLNDYSDFNVSTIDSFFQSILRTFAYESNLNDAYQVEIDSDYLAVEAVDSTFEEIDNGRAASDVASFWLELLMDYQKEKDKNWNVFQKSDNERSIYTRLLKSVGRLDEEKFKSIRQELDDYFKDGPERLMNAYKKAKEEIEGKYEEMGHRLSILAGKLERAIQDYVPNTDELNKNVASHIKKLKNYRNFGSPFSATTIKEKGVFKAKVKNPNADKVNAIAREMYELYDDWLNYASDGEMLHWNIYSNTIPYLGLIQESRRKISDFLESNNLVQLGETNTMLHRIIGDDDTPFIYERMGTFINHYLIDEFQDTSKMQWENLRPLLLENNGRGEDNLIIGDAKQSIYRFRSAEPSLITREVPKTFTPHEAVGTAKEDNTNWRSSRRIVEFNNFLFHFLAAEADKAIETTGENSINFTSLYSNVVQHPSHRDPRGYVEVRFIEKDYSDEHSTEDKALSQLGPLITGLISRKYRQKDIAILVKSNDLGKKVIASLDEYNKTLADSKKIAFVSEQSLLISSSPAVGIIIDVLRKLAAATVAPPPSPKQPSAADPSSDTDDTPRRNWSDMRCDFLFFSLSHECTDLGEAVGKFLKDKAPVDSIRTMLSKMKTVALPALVEDVIGNFVPENMRQSQAVYISGFQDLVIEYCSGNTSDLASFLEWWDGKGVTKSISSPEGTDAVQVMTIHKAKGLEFKCVIIPFEDSNLLPVSDKNEWAWVEPRGGLERFDFPKKMPVEMKTSLAKSCLADIYEEFSEKHMMDMLNRLYVAFTRAIDELYIFTERKSGRNSDTKIPNLIEKFCSDADSMVASLPDQDNMFPPGLFKWNDDRSVMTFGTPCEATEPDNNPDNANIIREYRADCNATVVHYVEDLGQTTDDEEVEEEGNSDSNSSRPLPAEAADNDPRSEGNLLHAVMAGVKVKEDLQRSLLSLKTRGLISSRQAADWEEMLGAALADPATDEWFAPHWEVLSERSIILPGGKLRRPDRILLSRKDGKAIVVDYKFGEIDRSGAHARQVKGYAEALRKTLGLQHVEAYLWYVVSQKIEQVVSR